MKMILLTLMVLSSNAALAEPKLVSVSIDAYSSEIGVISHNVAQVLSNAAHTQCASGVSKMTNINLQFTANAKPLKDDAEQGKILMGEGTVIATGLVTCK